MNKKFMGDAQQKAAPAFEHVAGDYEGNIQLCERCGDVLIDDRQANAPIGHSARPRGFKRGTAVVKQGSLLMAGSDPEVQKCSARE